MKTLVTGGAGFIGGHLVEALVREGHEVRVLDNFSGAIPECATSCGAPPFGRFVEALEGDVRDPAACARAVRGMDLVFHLAADVSVQRSFVQPAACHEVNVTGTLNVLVAARDLGAQRVVFASSSAVYGDGAAMPVREDAPVRPISPYGAAKLAAEHYARLFFEHYGLETVTLRYFNVFGPRQDPLSEHAAVIPRFVYSALSGQPPVIYGDGEQTRDFVAVHNVVQANLLAAASPLAAGKTYNVGSGEATTVNALLDTISRLTGEWVQPVYLPSRSGESRYSAADIRVAHRELGYKPRVDLVNGLAAMLDQRPPHSHTLTPSHPHTLTPSHPHTLDLRRAA